MSRSIPIMIIRMILAKCFSILQPVVAHEVRLLVSAIFNPNLHGRSTPTRTENPRLPARKFRGTRAENPCRSAQLSAGVRSEQPQNSSEKVKFSVSCTVHETVGVCITVCVHVCACACACVCDYKYMCKEEWVAGPNINWRTFHKPRLLAKILPSLLDMYGRCSHK